MLKEKAYAKGDFKLSSGRNSPHYLNCKNVILDGEGLTMASYLLLGLVEDDAKAVGGLTLGADPLVSGVAIASYDVDWHDTMSAFIVRKEPKGHGTQAWIEGPPLKAGAKVTILEDVITTGGSSIKAALKLREAGYTVDRIVTLVDRQEQGEADINMCAAKLELFSVYQLQELI